MQEAHPQPLMKPAHMHNEDNQAVSPWKTCFHGKLCDHGSASSGTVHKGWVVSKASFSFPYPWTVSRQIAVEQGLALA